MGSFKASSTFSSYKTFVTIRGKESCLSKDTFLDLSNNGGDDYTVLIHDAPDMNGVLLVRTLLCRAGPELISHRKEPQHGKEHILQEPSMILW